ncbi:glycosyltransferase family 2 protein [Teichococcus aestuarii]|uniref:glycosyltransferase family 2 protein n=1 Tax=Teichococcus aestuarii TaxID=568898 RepID=UPI003607FB2A
MSSDRPLAALPLVAIAVPVLNEEHYIADCLASLLTQGDGYRLEVLVLDGGSTDRTREIVAGIQLRHPEVRLLHNPARLQSAAVNQAAREASPEARILLRADAHAWYPPGFVTRVCQCLEARTGPSAGATSVVVPMKTEGHAGMQRAIALAQNSKLGNGGSAHRAGGVSGWVDHGHHAAFNRDFFRSIGGYDEAFTHNEDAELDHRAHLAGGKVWMCREAPVTYYPRKDLPSLARQYMKHGAGRARTLMKHGLRPRPRQMAPVAALLGCAGAVLLAPFWPPFLFIPLAYALLCLGWGAAQAAKARDLSLLPVGLAVMTMHLAWGFGFLRGAWRHRRDRMPPQPQRPTA